MKQWATSRSMIAVSKLKLNSWLQSLYTIMKEFVSDIINQYFGISLKSKVKVPISVIIEVVNG